MSVTCSICDKEAVPKYTPFCSKRCADIDLGRWLKGGYSIAGSDSPDSEMAPSPLEDD